MKINEIMAPSELISFQWNKNLIDNISAWDYIEGFPIYQLSISHLTFYFLCNDNQDLLAYVAIGPEENGFHSFERMEKKSKEGGLITMLVVRLISKGIKLVIKNTEALTSDGLNWITKLLATKGRGLKLYDQNGNFPDARSLRKEWSDNFVDDIPGSTSIFIENNSIDSNKILEENIQWKKVKSEGSIVIPFCKYHGDPWNL